jgi:hypothetical protein
MSAQHHEPIGVRQVGAIMESSESSQEPTAEDVRREVAFEMPRREQSEREESAESFETCATTGWDK